MEAAFLVALDVLLHLGTGFKVNLLFADDLTCSHVRQQKSKYFKRQNIEFCIFYIILC